VTKLKQNSSFFLTVATALSLWLLQTQLADTNQLFIRLLLNLGVIFIAAAIMTHNRFRSMFGSAPDPTLLVLCGLIALGVWPAAWWLMDLTDHYVMSIETPRHVSSFSESASYELLVLFSVILLPLAIAWLLWGVVQPQLSASLGRRAAAGIMSLLGGLFLSMIAIQQVVPGMPWGTPSLPGYLLIAAAAAWCVYFLRSFWAGFAAYGTFAYANFALQDDLFRAMAGKGYLDPAWLTMIVLGVAGALLLLQVIRFRLQPAQQRDQESEQTKSS
jgi:hypothetical protein